MPPAVLDKATKPLLETSLIVTGERVYGWYWKEGSSRVAIFSKYKYKCPVKFEFERENDISLCVKLSHAVFGTYWD